MRKSTGLPMMLVSLYSPNKAYDALFLANYANINIVDALYRVPGVGEVRVFGAGDYAMRIWVQARSPGDDGADRAEICRRRCSSRARSTRPDRSAASPAPTGPGHDLHGSRRGPAADARRNSATSSCARIPTARSCT